MYLRTIKNPTQYNMRNEDDPNDQKNNDEDTESYNTSYYRPGYPTYDQQGNIYPPNAPQTQGGYPYVAVGSNNGQQGAPVYPWPNQTIPPVPSQSNPNPDPHQYPHMYQNSTMAYNTSAYPTAGPQLMQHSPMGMLPQPLLQPIPMPGPSGSRYVMQTNTNTREEAGVGIHQCPHCGLKFDRPGRFEAHLNGHRDIRPYACDGTCGTADCNMAFTSVEALGSHKKKDRSQCENCGNLVAKKNMARHHKSHCPSLF